MKKSLIMISFWQYNEVVSDMTKDISKSNSKVCYVTLNKTYLSIAKTFANSKIDLNKFYFLDLITPNLFKPEPSENCGFLDISQGIESFSEKLIELVQTTGSKHIIFDSISSFLVYKKDREVVEFFNHIISLLEEMDVSITVFSLTDDEKRPAVMQMKMLADKTQRF
jgi:KaiC/GvpD/RAD55 family RecA-like ATPase